MVTIIHQVFAITAGTFFAYQYFVYQAFDEAHASTIVFTGLLVANIVLTLVNHSFYYSILTTMRYKNGLVLFIIAITITITGLLLFGSPLTMFFEFETPAITQLFTCTGIGFISVIWYELVKIKKRLQPNSAGS